MPNKVLRKLLVAFLVVLIPIQGFAALSMGFCGDLEKGADGMAHAHAASTPAMNHGQLSAGDSDDLADDFDSELAHCAACAACGVSAGIDMHVMLSIAAAPREGAIAHRVTRSPGFVPDGLYRPPLMMLA